MLTQSDIRTAVEFEAQGQPHERSVLSVYLNVDPNTCSVEQYKQVLRTLLNKAADRAQAEDIKRVQNFVEMGFNRKGRGLILFSCVAHDFWWAQTVAAPVSDEVFVSFRPYVRQLASLIDTYGQVGLIQVEQEGARLYLFNMGELESVDGYLGEEIKTHKAGGWSAARYQRHESGQARHNLQEAAEQAEDFYRSSGSNRLILAGTEKNVAQFKDLLSNRLRAMIIGRVTISPNANRAEIQQKALELAQQAAHQDAIELADSVVARSQANHNALTGLVETLTAVQDGRAQQVVVLSNYSQTGYRFVDSGKILLELNDQAELGSGRIQELPDAVESVIRRSLLQNIGITLLPEHAGLEIAGKIGALTRY